MGALDVRCLYEIHTIRYLQISEEDVFSKETQSLELIPSKPYPFSRTKTLENLHYGDQDDVPLVLKPLLKKIVNE
jgi:hypothetical protein